MMIAVGMGLTSCLKNDADDAETISYNETAISSFALSAVNRYIHTTTSAGKDSVYRQVLTVKNYPFTIDQYQRKIYNHSFMFFIMHGYGKGKKNMIFFCFSLT